MRDNFSEPSLADILRRYDQRLEALEMGKRNGRTPVQLAMFMSPNQSLSAPASLGALGAAASYIDNSAFREAWIGDFTALGPNLNGKVFYWMPPGHQMEMQVTVTEVGSALPKYVIYTETGIAASGDGGYWYAQIPDASFNGDDIRGKYMRMSIEIRMTVGTDRVGAALSTNPYNYPDA